MLKVLMLGDIYGSIGRRMVKDNIKQLVSYHHIDLVIANGENATHGKSLSYDHYLELKQLGVDVITSGNHIFKRNDVLEYIASTPDLLKPLNMNKYTPGAGTIVKDVKNKKVRITNLMGTVYMDPVDNPYWELDQLLKKDKSDIHLIDFHGEATAEKIAFAWNYDGKIAALVGTHTHVQTADERILPNGTAFITDLGMCGAINSIIGADPDTVIKKEKYGYPSRFAPAKGPGLLCGIVITIDDFTNKAESIERIMVKE